MLRRLDLAGRIVLILLMLLIALGLSGIAVSFIARSQDAGVGPRLPLPDQAAAIADLIEATPPARRELVLRAVNSEELRVSIVPTRPVPPPHARSFPVVEWMLANYLESARLRSVEILQLPPPDAGLVRRVLAWWAPGTQSSIRIVMPLQSGEVVLLETRGNFTQRLFGLPTGFWVGVVGALLGLLAIIAIVREARPLSDLAQSVIRFSAAATPAPVASRGAPDVKALIDAVNGMQGRIAGLLKGRTVLLGAVSHDLKTFITRLRLRVEDIADTAQRDKAIADLDSMTHVVDDAIAVARGAAVPSHQSAIELDGLLRRAADMHGRDRVDVVLAPALAGARMVGDEIGLLRLFDNIVANALRYGTRCRIEATSSPTAITVDIDDDGPGIPPKEREAVFEPFYRIEGSRSRETGGSGLGLAIAKQVADAHGAAIEIGEAPLGGSRFRIRFPAAAATARPGAPSPARLTHAPAPAPARPCRG